LAEMFNGLASYFKTLYPQEMSYPVYELDPDPPSICYLASDGL